MHYLWAKITNRPILGQGVSCRYGRVEVLYINIHLSLNNAFLPLSVKPETCQAEASYVIFKDFEFPLL